MKIENHGKRSLEEMLAQSNEQILSKWSTLASFIRLNEYDETNPKDWSKGWHPSRGKAIYLLSTKTAEDYINKVRDRFATPIIKSDPVPEVENIEKTQPPEPVKVKASIYQENYERLIKLIPDLEERIASGKDLNGLSNIIGYHGIILLKTIRLENHVADVQVYHYVQDGRDYRVETMMAIRIDVAKMTVEPLLFQCKNGKCKVYHRKDGVENELLDTKEQERQNKLLSSFLENLIQNRHHFEWVDETKNDLYFDLSRFQFNYEPNNDTEEALIDVNKTLSDVMDMQSEIEWKIKKREEERQRKKDKKTEREFRIMVLESWKDCINDEIPDFEPGNVEFVEVYNDIGVTQDDIDWINENQQAISFFPNKDSDVSGFELLANGKVRFA